MVGMAAFFSAACLPLKDQFRIINLFCSQSTWMTRTVFLISTAAHIDEAICAWHLAKRMDLVNTSGSFWRTFALGFFSLRFLLKVPTSRTFVRSRLVRL